MSRDGTDFFHLHANASSPYTTEFYVGPTFLRPVDHLLAASYVTETNRLGVCIAEIASHAHGQDAERGVFPQLTDAWVVSVGDGGGVGGGATTGGAARLDGGGDDVERVREGRRRQRRRPLLLRRLLRTLAIVVLLLRRRRRRARGAPRDRRVRRALRIGVH